MVIGNNIFSLLFMTVTMLPFFYATMEHYYTGTLIMQTVNGVDDGSLLYFFFCLVSAYYGAEYLWAAEYSYFGLKNLRGVQYVAILIHFFIFFCIFDKYLSWLTICLVLRVSTRKDIATISRRCLSSNISLLIISSTSSTSDSSSPQLTSHLNKS